LPTGNPADLGRYGIGVPLQELVNNPLWWHGPTCLQRPWPSQGTDLPVTDIEKRAVKAHVASMPTEDFLDRFFKLDRAVRVLACVHRFVQRCRRQPPLSGVRIEAQDVAAAEQLMTICTQRRYFPEEYRCLSQKRPVPAASSIRPLLGRGGLIAKITEAPRSNGTQKTRRYFGVFNATCLGVY